jgi:hypothetical protein
LDEDDDEENDEEEDEEEEDPQTYCARDPGHSQLPSQLQRHLERKE